VFLVEKQEEEEEDNSHSHPHEPAKATLVESDSDDDILFATSSERESVFEWILDSEYTYHTCPHRD